MSTPAVSIAPAAELGSVSLVCGVRPDGRNAILEYTNLLDDALRAAGVDSRVLAAHGRLPDLGASDVVLLQYNPYLYGRRGLAPALVRSWLAARREHADATFALMAHELFDPISDWRSALAGGAQRAQLRVLHRTSDALFVSTGPWADRLAGWRPTRPVFHLAVGSNLPESATDPLATRAELAVAPDTPLLACFGTAHRSRLLGHIAAALNAVAEDAGGATLLHLGAGAPPLPELNAAAHVIAPGELDGAEVARLLRCADLFLAPFSDGASTRRGSLMAALQAGLPVAATAGPVTDQLLRGSSAIDLVTADASGFARTVVSLMRDPQRRAAMALAARSLYEREFAWPVIAQRLCRGLCEVRAGGR